ncbi:MAG: VWA domain-containing protein [Rubrivivax sp.]|nr:VWA domain-containing protein [Pyrinomonadaceae bacterium]
MKHQEAFDLRKWRSRLVPVALILFAVFATLIPASAARQTTGRPRRVSSAQNMTQKATPTPQKIAPQATATPKPTPAASKQTPVRVEEDEPPPPMPGAPKFQVSPSAQADAAKQDPSDEEIEEGGIVRVEANLVNLHVRVIDRNNRPIGDVKQEEFRVFENGVQQQVQFVNKEEVPVTYGLVVDNSGSLRNQINQVIEAGKTIVDSNKPGDETFVVRFISSEDIKIMQDFTADKTALGDALEDMFVEGGQTAIIDAVYLSATHTAERRKGDPLEDKRRRALIVVTDGEDRASFYKQEQLFESLKEEDVQIYVIGFVNELDKERGFISKSKRQKAVDLLDKIAKETGGRTFYPTSLSELPGIAEEITKDLRTQYVISYVPTAKARPGEFRPVRVAVADAPNREKRIAVTRSGYTAKGEGAPPAPSQSPPTVRRQ